ncbi:MAG: hypothetical protein J2P54_02410 [Bradyrhizobiaceae bacterium]|nr:hypothetical protein [Bradyrhizobiaceae bacterium]
MLLLDVLQSYHDWDRLAQTATMVAQRSPRQALLFVAIILTIIIGGFVLIGTLTLLVSRRRSKIAMWVSIALFAISFAVLVLDIGSDITSARLVWEHLITALEHIGAGVALGLLFTPSARRWMSRKDEKNEKLREIFE